MVHCSCLSPSSISAPSSCLSWRPEHFRHLTSHLWFHTACASPAVLNRRSQPPAGTWTLDTYHVYIYRDTVFLLLYSSASDEQSACTSEDRVVVSLRVITNSLNADDPAWFEGGETSTHASPGAMKWSFVCASARHRERERSWKTV